MYIENIFVSCIFILDLLDVEPQETFTKSNLMQKYHPLKNSEHVAGLP